MADRDYTSEQDYDLGSAGRIGRWVAIGFVLLCLAAWFAACASMLAPKPQPVPIPTPVPPAVAQHSVAVVVAADGRPLAGARCAGEAQEGVTNQDGYVLFPPFDAGERTIGCDAPGFDAIWITFQNDGVENPATGYPNIRVALKRIVQPLPPVPSRDELATAQLTFQGLTLDCGDEYTGPAPDPFLDVLSPACRQRFYAMKRAAGDKAIAIALAHAYNEPGVHPKLSEGKDWTKDWPGFRAFLQEVIGAGFYVQLHLAGDGDCPNTGGYCDTVGWTYGYQWLIDNLPTIVREVGAYGDYIRWGPGFDGVFYGWEPSAEKVPTFARVLRSLKPNAVIFLEFNWGHIPIGEGGDDYKPGGRMQDYDLILAEIAPGLNDDTFYQIVARLVPRYTRPPDQPVGDDPNPPYYLGTPNPRGPWFFNCFEWNLYGWVRSQVSSDQIQRDRQRLRAAGCSIVG